MADEHGLSTLEPGSSRFKSWSEAGIDSPARCLSLEKSKDGFIWAATYEGKLVQIDEATLHGWQLNLPHVSHVFVDSRDRVWASSDEGLFSVNAVTAEPSFTRLKARCLGADSD